MSAAYRLAPESLASGRSALEVWTEKEGLLSRVAHDLCIAAEEARVELSPDAAGWRLEVEVPVRSLRVRGQVKGEEVTPLSAKDHAEIEKNLRGPKVLDAGRFPQTVFRGTCAVEGERARVTGELELHGRRRSLPLEGTWRSSGEDELELRGEVRFKQSDWGISPYSAMLGALKLKDSLRVRWRLTLSRL